LILGYQNLAQVHDQYGTDGANAILGSIGTTIFLPGLDDVTTQFASRRIGQTTVWSHTTVDGKGTSLDNERQTETGRALMDPAELRQMVKHKQCVVIIDSQPPIKASYPPLAMSPQRALAVDYGEPQLVTLIQGETAYLAKLKEELDKQQVTGVVADISMLPTIDGGVNYTRTQGVLPLATVNDAVVSNVVGEVQDGKVPNQQNSNQGTLFHSDQAVGDTFVKSATKVVVGPKSPKSVTRTVRVKKKAPAQVVHQGSIVNDTPVESAGAVEHDVEHDALR
jgi:hypothetical protein